MCVCGVCASGVCGGVCASGVCGGVCVCGVCVCVQLLSHVCIFATP